MELVPSFLHSCQIRDKVRFPGLASIGGKGLLHMVRVRGDVRPHEPDQDAPAIEGVLAIKLATSILEFTDQGRLAQGAVVDVGEGLAPLMRLWVVEEESESLKVRRAIARFELFKIGSPIPDLAHRDGPIQFDPGCGAGQGMNEPLDVCLEGAEVEVEVVLTITKGLRWSGLRKCCGLRCDGGKGKYESCCYEMSKAIHLFSPGVQKNSKFNARMPHAIQC